MSDQDNRDAEVDETEDHAQDTTTEREPDTGKRDLDAAVAALRRENAKLKKDREKADRDKQAEQGRWKELAEQAERERDELKAASERSARERVATSVASRLKFRDPEDAMRFLSADDLADENTAERALKKLAKDKDYLIQPARERTGAAVGSPGEPGDGSDPLLAQGQRILAAFERSRPQ